MTLARFRRLATVDRDELRVRLVSAVRQAVDRTRAALVTPVWNRRDLASVLSPAAPAHARDALKQQRWHDAHAAFAKHFAARPSAFPLQAADGRALADLIRRTFPDAGSDAARRARKILSGKYDVLGYCDVAFGVLPDWHADPVNHARAPRRFWASVPFLSAACGDHKVIWEINRHQHWIALGRSRILNDDRACYKAFVSQLEDWLVQNPPLVGINWASMLELALRSISWLWALHLFAPDARHDRPQHAPWTVDLLLALDRQLTHVEHNVSRYFSPNTHLTGEALALYVAGHALPELSASGRRVEIGRDILLTEIDRQINGDGGHAELSPHYHRYTSDFYLLALLVARRSGDLAAVRFEEAARRLARYLRTIADDSGSLPLIGDDDGGRLFDVSGREPSDASSTLAIASVALEDERLAIGSVTEEALWWCGHAAAVPSSPPAPNVWQSAALRESGYYVIRHDGDHAVFDAGRHGFLNGGHAHADALSLVLSVRRTPLLVDPGTGVYTVDPALRDRFRSSAMHNTVVLDGRPQSLPGGPFHWRSRVDAEATLWRPQSGCDYVEATHSGYAPVRHTRGLLAIHGFGWLVFDHFLSEGTVTADTFWHLHPDWSVELNRGTATLTHGSGIQTSLATTGGPLRVLGPGDSSELALFAPAYGRIVETHVLTSRARLTLPASFATFVAADAAATRDVRIDARRTTGEPDPNWHSFGVELTFDTGSAKAICAVEREPGKASKPPHVWGVSGLRTDGRVAAVINRRGLPPVTIAIEGSLVDAGAEPLPAELLEHIS